MATLSGNEAASARVTTPVPAATSRRPPTGMAPTRRVPGLRHTAANQRHEQRLVHLQKRNSEVRVRLFTPRNTSLTRWRATLRGG